MFTASGGATQVGAHYQGVRRAFNGTSSGSRRENRRAVVEGDAGTGGISHHKEGTGRRQHVDKSSESSGNSCKVKAIFFHSFSFFLFLSFFFFFLPAEHGNLAKQD